VSRKPRFGPAAGYVFPAVVINDIDGDTVKLDVELGPPGKNRDLGFHVYTDEHGHVHLHYSFRVLGENAAEHGTPMGDKATAFVTALLPPAAAATIKSSAHPDDKFGGRYDASITLADGEDLAAEEIAAGFAVPWTGSGPKPVPS
jgi:endonuclease YncB( thermonuclease family)